MLTVFYFAGMKSRLLPRLFAVFLSLSYSFSVHGQFHFEIENPSHPEHFFIEIPSDTAGVFAAHKGPFGGISAIEYSGKSNRYFLLSDGVPSRYYTFAIDLRGKMECQLKSVSYLPYAGIRGEAIRLAGHHIFLTDERVIDGMEKTLFWRLERPGNLVEIATLGNEYYGEMYDNSGFEGLAVSPDHQRLYLAMERALPASSCRGMVPILEYTITTGETREFYYPFQIAGNSNGISEVLSLSDSILLVIERDYLKDENRNTVNFYSVDFHRQNPQLPADCGIPEFATLLQPKLIFSLDSVTHLGGIPFKVNNVEGATFSADGRYLLLVTDNNFGNKGNATPTQVIALKVKGR